MAGRYGDYPIYIFSANRRTGSKSCRCRIYYGIERLASYIQDKENVFDLEWIDDLTFRDIFYQPEFEHSKYSFEESDTEMLFSLFQMYEKEAKRTMEKGLVFPAYDYVLKCSHTFNLLDARGVISVTERTSYIGRVPDSLPA